MPNVTRISAVLVLVKKAKAMRADDGPE